MPPPVRRSLSFAGRAAPVGSPLLFSGASLLAVLALSGCGQPSAGAGGMGGMPPPLVSTMVVQPASYPVTFEYVGQTAGSKEAEVRARVTGIVEKRLYPEGAPVRAGQVLFQLDAKPYEAQLAAAEAELLRAKAQKTQAEREAARLRPLAVAKAIGQKEADDAASAADFAAAALKAAQARLSEARLNHSYTRVTAPVSGLSSRAQQSEGSLANANTTLLTTVSQVDPIWVLFSVSDNEKLRLNKAIAEGRLTLPKQNAFEVQIKLADGSLFPRSGRINFADSRVNPQTGTYEMRAEIANGDLALKPGQFVRVALKGAQRSAALAVPQSAVLEGPQGKFVYVVGKATSKEKGDDKGDDKAGQPVAVARPVVVGDWSMQQGANVWLIESGLAAGDEVIVDGVARIMMPNTPIQIVPPGAPAAAAAPARP